MGYGHSEKTTLGKARHNDDQQNGGVQLAALCRSVLRLTTHPLMFSWR